MHAISATKRRRLNESNATLSRPFKSPLKTSPDAAKSTTTIPPPVHSPSSLEARDDPFDPQITKPATQLATGSSKEDDESASLPDSQDAHLSASSKVLSSQAPPDQSPRSLCHAFTPIHPVRLPTSPSGAVPQESDLTASALSTTVTITTPISCSEPSQSPITLQRTIQALQADIDTLLEAKRIISADRADDLIELTKKWKTVSREAAEQVFERAREKVEAMGGARAWKRHEQEARGQRRAWDEENQRAELEIEREKVRKKKRRRRLCEGREEGGHWSDTRLDDGGSSPLTGKYADRFGEHEGRASEVVAADSALDEAGDGLDECFTIDKMLLSMGVDLDAIGYDKKEQRWSG